MKQKMHKDLQALFDFFRKQRANPPAEFSHGAGVIKNPSFFTLKDFQAHQNNPLLKPEWVHVKHDGRRVELEKACMYKTVQGRELDFMDKGMLNSAINAGAAVVLEGIDILDSDINLISAKIDQSLPCVMSSAVVFFSQKDCEAYEGHCDTDDVLVIQLAGKKTWQLFKPQQRRYADIQNLSDAKLGPVMHEVTLRPGDALYLRAGVPHRCITPTPASLHLSFDLTDNSPTTAEIAKQASVQYNHACELPYEASPRVIDRFISILDDENFKNAITEACDIKKNQILEFRESLDRAHGVKSLSKFN